jgi:hypothetical protein
MTHPTQLNVPREYAGQWIAWTHDLTRIIASGESLAEVVQAAEQTGETDPVIDKVPRADVRLIGARTR